MRAILQKADNKKRANILFIGLDALLSLICSCFGFAKIPQLCLVSFFFYYSLLFCCQSFEHWLIHKLPTADVSKHSFKIKAGIAIVSIVQTSYLFLTIFFWQRSDLHPMYCTMCLYLGLPVLIGIVFIVHFIVTLMVLITVIHGYVSRKYYLLALGGFDVQIRLREEREASLRRVNLLEPDVNYYPAVVVLKKDKKYYHFEDVIECEVQDQEKSCSICLNSLAKLSNEEAPVLTSCKHTFHRKCIEKWAMINSKCPECRASFEQIKEDSSSTNPESAS